MLRSRLVEGLQLQNFLQSKILTVIGLQLVHDYLLLHQMDLVSFNAWLAGYYVLIHHACQAEWENGEPCQETQGCNKFCVRHHPAAKLLAVLERPVAGKTSVLTNSISNEAQPVPTASRTDSLFPDSSKEESNEVKVSVSIAYMSEFI